MQRLREVKRQRKEVRRMRREKETKGKTGK